MSTPTHYEKISRRNMLLFAAAGVALPASRIHFAVRKLFGADCNKCAVSLDGPFATDHNLLASHLDTSWMTLTYVAVCGQHMQDLQVFYEFKGVTDPHRTIKAVFSITTQDGAVHTLFDQETDDPRLMTQPVWHGSQRVYFRPCCGGVLPLPVNQSEITRVDLRFENIVRSLGSAETGIR